MKKRSSSSLLIHHHQHHHHYHHHQHYFWLGLKLLICASIIFCIYSLIKLNNNPPASEDEDGFSEFIREEIDTQFAGPPKIAFLFLAREKLPLDFLWNHFFMNADSGNFSIYIHSKPGFVFDESTSKCTFCYGRQLNESIQVAWGESSMIEAERILFRAALRDPANQRFVLVSDSCVPLYNFSYIYDYLMSSSKSFVDSFLDKKEGRYNPKMSPTIPKDKWRKGSQWIALVRKHAAVVVTDYTVFPAFKKYCKRRPPLDLNAKKISGPVIQKEHNCIPDEHYVQTLLAMSDLEDEVQRRTLTYTLWNQSATEMERQGWHPITFKYANAGPEQIQKIKDIRHVYYETEERTEWCKNNGRSVPCFLFARKFLRSAAMRLMNEGVVGPFDATQSLAIISSAS